MQATSTMVTKSTTAAVLLQLVLLVLTALVEVQAQCRHATLIRTGVTLEERSQILDTHNRLRSQVAQGTVPNQPGAQNMQEMVWDEELAYKAQQWAQQCTFDHDPGRYLNRFTMGQNLAIIWSTIPLADDDGDFPSRIQNWFNEVQKYAWGAQWSEATGHYSQLVWGDTNLIGCGFSYYKDARRFNKLWVCNYGPGGNVVGSNPYEVGHPSCSNYGMQPSYRYSGLCSNGNGGGGNLQSNYIGGHNSFSYKTESYNAPSYQAPSGPQQPQPQPIQTLQPQPQPPSQPLQNVFKPIVQAVVQPVNNFINTDYSFKSIFDRFKDVLNLQRVSVPASSGDQPLSFAQAQSNPFNQQPNNNNNNNDQVSQPYQQPQQYSQYQPPTAYQQQQPQQQQQYQQQPAAPVYQQQPSYDTGAYQQSYQQPQQPVYQQQQPAQPQQQSYFSQPTVNRNNNPFLTYDWSQLFNQNGDKNNG